MLIASMNPCPCGYYGAKGKNCTCSKTQISKYIHKISGPLLDRIDIHIEVEAVSYEKLEKEEKQQSSETIRKKVNMARKIGQKRYENYGIYANAQLTPKLVEKYCKLGIKEKEILKNAFEQLGLSARAYTRILKVARTVADLEQKEEIELSHIAEAITYRNLDRKYWGI